MISQHARNILKRLSADDLDLLANEADLSQDKRFMLNDAAAVVRELNTQALQDEEDDVHP